MKLGDFVLVGNKGTFQIVWESSHVELILMEGSSFDNMWYVLVSRIVAGIYETREEAEEKFYKLKWNYIPTSAIISGKITRDNFKEAG